MDDFTQGMAERARQRREALNKKKKMAETPVRKRGVNPEGEELKGGSDLTDTANDDSPNKRPCLQDLDNQMNVHQNETKTSSYVVKSDCPDNTITDSENMDVKAPFPQKLYILTESESKMAPSISGSQRSRFAALADRYKSWEDDLSHHKFRKEEKQPSKADKYRYPQVEASNNASEPSKSISETNKSIPEPTTKRVPEALANVPKACKDVCPMLVTDISVVGYLSEHSNGVRFETAEKGRGEPLTVPVAAETKASVEEPVYAQTSPARLAEDEIVVPPPPSINIPATAATEVKIKESGRGENMGHVSSLTFTIGSKGKAIVQENKDTVSVSSTVSTARTVSVQSAVLCPSAVPASGAVSIPSAVKKVSQLSVNNSDLNRSVSDEPTHKPVSARLEAWQSKVAANEEKPSVNARVRMLEHKFRDGGQKRSPHSKPSTPTGSSPKLTHGSPASSPLIKAGSLQKRSSSRKSKGTLTVSPLAKNSSPVKVQPATQSMHERLSKFCEARTNELVEKSRAGRAEELAVLENRWKNGVLAEGAERGESNFETSLLKSSVVNFSASAPFASPLPPDASAGTVSSPCTPNRRRSRSADSPASNHSAKSTKKEEARNKIRADFESKLRMMGFDVNASGTTAAVQLDAILEHGADKSNSKSEEMHAKKSQNTPSKFLNENLEHVGDRKTMESATASNPNAAGAGSSIYNLIKKQIGGSTPTASATAVPTLAPMVPASVPTPAPNNLLSKKDEKRWIRRRSTDEELMESEMDSFDELAEFKKPAPVAEKMRRPTTVTFSTSVQEYTMSDQSESVDSTIQYSEAESCATDDGATHADNERDMEENGGGCSDQTDPEDDEEERGDGEVSDLLDEVLMDSAEEEVREKDCATPMAQPPPSTVQEPSSNVLPAKSEVVMRRPNSRREAARANDDLEPRGYISIQQYRQQTARPKSQPPGPSHAQHDATALKRATVMTDHGHSTAPHGDGAFYGQRRDMATTASTSQSRNSPAKRTRGLYPDLTVELSSGTDGQYREKDKMPYIPEKSAKQRIQELQDLVRQELNVIQQTSNALNQCCQGGSVFVGSAEAVECHRLLLMACKKREAYMVEMQRLRERPSMLNHEGPKGRLTISDMRLPLKTDFASKIGSSHDTSVHYFLVMIRHGSHIVFSQMVSSREAAARGSVDFPNLINLPNIHQKFLIDLEVYAMSVTRDNDSSTPKKKKGMTPKKLLTPRSSRTLQSPGGPMAVRLTNFTNVASLQLTMSQLNKTHFTLERVPFSSPLQGSVHLKLKCLIESHIEEKGFLTMFEDVSGFGAWHRRWFLLKGGQLSYWKYPDKEKDMEPLGVIDLKSCISDRIDLVSREACARPNTFEVTVVRKQQREERDTLVTKCYDTLSTTKHWISADTKEERITWCAKLNETLINVRAWQSDALRPIKPRNAYP